MAERVKFPGDPTPGSTVPPGGKENPNIPLTASVQGTTETLLTPSGGEDEEAGKLKDFRSKPSKPSDDIDEDDLGADDDAGPSYNRERLGARVGMPVEESMKVEAYEKNLDKEDVVPCMFRTPVHLNHEGLMHHWAPGVQLVPLSIAGAKNTEHKMHWWLRHNGVKRTGTPQPSPRASSGDESDDVEAA